MTSSASVSVQNICNEHVISSASFYKWGLTFNGIDMPIMKRLKEFEEENENGKVIR
ncbi:transposase [Thorsellia kenyensis]|uniref:Transposase n=1 Tax=Thorsellia kenyensis TaxID=1549888 RepID=A0ABV6CAE7_9GAMM